MGSQGCPHWMRRKQTMACNVTEMCFFWGFVRNWGEEDHNHSEYTQGLLWPDEKPTTANSVGSKDNDTRDQSPQQWCWYEQPGKKSLAVFANMVWLWYLQWCCWLSFQGWLSAVWFVACCLFTRLCLLELCNLVWENNNQNSLEIKLCIFPHHILKPQCSSGGNHVAESGCSSHQFIS